MTRLSTKLITAVLLSLMMVLAACGADDGPADQASSAEDASPAVADTSAEPTIAPAPTSTAVPAEASDPPEAADPTAVVEPTAAAADADSTTTSSFQIEVWADNWMAVYVDGELVGEDSVAITTERSFNAETFTFEAAYPFTVAIEAKDFKETDSGIEYIGEPNQQMGDGGIIAQVTDTATGEIVAVTDASWSALVVHRAPLNTECVNDADPDATCEFEIIEAPSDWFGIGFDDGTWTAATVWSAADVDPKQGYDEIVWDAAAELIWGTDLEVDNTVLLRTTVGG